MLNQLKKILFIGILLLTLALSFIYAYNKFVWQNNEIEQVKLYMNKSYNQTSPVLYAINNNGLGFDFSKPYSSKIAPDSSIYFILDKTKELRKFKIYFEKKSTNLIIEKIVLFSKKNKAEVQLNNLLFGNNLNVLNDKEGKLKVNVQEPGGFLETKEFYIYGSDKKSILIISLGILIFLLLIFLLFRKLLLFQEIKPPNLSGFSIVLFLCSIFLPHPIFNITLVLSLLLVLRNFNLKQFLSEKMNLIFVFCFIVLFINDLFVAESGYHNLKSTETYLPLFILPIYISCIKTSKALIYLPISAVFFGILMFSTSIVDAVMFQNINYFSFNEFTKFTHPVYYSYLVSFSIFYLFFYSKMDKNYKNIIQGILFFFLILAGSKLVITLTFLMYAGLVIKNKKAAIIMIVGLVAMAFFPPVQNRFNDILNIEDLNIVNETVITENNDPRINGLTLRLLLWQESINVVKTVPEIIFGKGVGKATDDLMKLNMVKRGLGKYQRYSTHNQFVNIFMRAGIIGVFSLLMLIIYGLYQALIKKNKMLLVIVIMFTFAMLTESVFQKVLGIYFFTTVLLFLMKPKFTHENSNNWN